MGLEPQAPGRADGDLLDAYLDGDEAAFTELMRRHEDRIFAMALKMMGNRSDALDATQDTFIRAFRNAAKFRGDSAFGTWLYRIGLNSCHDLLRKRKRDPVPEEEIEQAGDHLPGVDERVVLNMELSAALADLQEDYRAAVLMHDLGGIPYEEIAVITEVSIGTVKSRISRGRRKLAELLEHPTSPDASKGQR